MGETGTEEVTRVVLGDDLHGYRYPVPSTFRNNWLADDDEKWSTLATIGIVKRHDRDTPLRAWRDAVAVESGLPADTFDLDNGGRALDLGFSPMHVRKLVWYLA